jgi:membrane protein implicated in regulation of membrane protease activity
VVVAAYETAQVLGWQSPIADLSVSAILVAALAVVFVYVFVRTRTSEAPEPAPDQMSSVVAPADRP